MPFQSEKQRRYLWANEPEIARDWTDTYGSRVRKQDGGMMSGILMQLARTVGVNKAMEMLGMGNDSDQDDNLPSGYFGNYLNNFNPTRTLTRIGLNQAFKGLTGQGSNLGALGALGPMAGIAGLGYMLNKNRLGLTGHLTQRDYETARSQRQAKTSQSNIIRTLESGNYVPGWEKSAFERIQKEGEKLGLVDAGESSPVPVGNGNQGNGNQGGGGGAQLGSGMTTGQHAAFRSAEGGLAALWPR